MTGDALSVSDSLASSSSEHHHFYHNRFEKDNNLLNNFTINEQHAITTSSNMLLPLSTSINMYGYSRGTSTRIVANKHIY